MQRSYCTIDIVEQYTATIQYRSILVQYYTW